MINMEATEEDDNLESGDEEEEEIEVPRWDLHPATIGWVMEKLGLEAISQQTHCYLIEELADRYDLAEHPRYLPVHKKEDLLAEVRRQIRRENDFAGDLYKRVAQQFIPKHQVRERRGEADTAPAAAIPDFLQTLEQATREALSRRAASDPGRSGRARQALNPDRAAVSAAAAEQARQEKLPDLLTEAEREGAAAISAYFSALLSQHPQVQSFRARILKTPSTVAADYRFLLEKGADQFLLSPAVRFLSLQEFKELGIHPSEHGAKLLEWETGFAVPEDIAALKAGDMALRGDVPISADEKDDSVDAAGMTPASIGGLGYYNTFFLRLRLESQEEDGDSRTDGALLPPQQAAPVEVERLYLQVESGSGNAAGSGISALPLVPFIPRGISPTSSRKGEPDDPLIRMFPGSVADDLRRLSERLARGLPFEPWQIALFLLRNEPPRLEPVTVSLRSTLLADAARRAAAAAEETAGGNQSGAVAGERAVAVETLLERFRMGVRLRASITITAEPWVSADTVKRYYSHYQQQALQQQALPRNKPSSKSSEVDAASESSGADKKERGGKPQTLRRSRLPGLWILRLARKAAIAYSTGAVSPEARRGRQQQRHSDTPMLPHPQHQGQQSLRGFLMNEEEEAKAGGDSSSPVPADTLRTRIAGNYPALLRSYRTAWEALDLPWDLASVLKSLAAGSRRPG